MKRFRILLFPLLVVLIIMIISSWIIQDPQPGDCEIVTTTITEVKEGTTFDIVFCDKWKSTYYINPGLEQGLNLDSLNAKVLNKTVTLHLPKLLGGLVTSRHIAQLALENEIVFTEFK